MRFLAVLVGCVNLAAVVLSVDVGAETAVGPGERPRWSGGLRAGYATASVSSTHPVRGGSWAGSAGLYARVLPWLSVGADAGYYGWQNKAACGSEPDAWHRSYTRAAWNVSLAASLDGFAFSREWPLDPVILLATGLYGRRYDSRSADHGPGVSAGLGVRYFPDAQLHGQGSKTGYGIIGRRHYVLMDDYGVMFAGPSHEWTKIWEVGAEVILLW